LRTPYAKPLVLMAFILCAGLLAGCYFAYDNMSIKNVETAVPVETAKAVYQKITAEQAKAIMDEGKPFVLLDVRTDEEFKEKRIDGAILIPDYEIKNRATAELPDKNALILVYCRSGRRSANAANELIKLGYTNVYDFGGIIDWPYDTVSG